MPDELPAWCTWLTASRSVYLLSAVASKPIDPCMRKEGCRPASFSTEYCFVLFRCGKFAAKKSQTRHGPMFCLRCFGGRLPTQRRGRIRRKYERAWLFIPSNYIVLGTFHAQFIDLARESVPPPAKKNGRISAPPAGVFERGLDHNFFKLWHGRLENCLFPSL